MDGVLDGRRMGAVVQTLCAGMCVIGLFHSEWLKPSGVLLGVLMVEGE